MQPPLPKSYPPNAVLDAVALECPDDLVSKSLSYAAGRIRETINKVTVEYVNSTIDFLRGIYDLSPFQELNTISTDDDRKELPYGNPNLSVISWLALQFHGVDFGWGEKIYMGPVDYGSDGYCVISSSGGHDYHGSVVVIVCLQEAHMGAFKKFFYEILAHESCCINSDGSHHMIDIKSSFQMKAMNSDAPSMLT
ncbi:hypothetical protein Salat_1702200 [Sesamum alatum]|uniref:Uncharacterized protein n=1 Tax=Sesamum alatum TaxID=300844 RepID=A0AAE1Y805_9LAMI|nr:hypothetical protein Salat_1702200 [Sesamum alatum]